VNSGAPLPSVEEAQGRVLHFQRKLHEWASIDAERRFRHLWNLVETTRCAHGEPDAVEVARPVRRATARKPPADKAGPAPRRRPYLRETGSRTHETPAFRPARALWMPLADAPLAGAALLR
jgi:hypothetical protein